MHPKFTEEVEKAVKNSKYKYRKDLPDGRVRFYRKHALAGDKDPNAFTSGGRSHVREVNPRTGKVREWEECYQKPSEARPKEARGGAPQNDLHVVQIHPEPKIDGVVQEIQHYPFTSKDVEKFQSGKIPGLNTKPNPLEKN
ncbi:hypothetical protein HCUR_00200 [Holospora curviuscula]|uniref:Uncharacterized protein n=1 Tax=Holospora curviuscula TaxID=1082868 RepID=A0A2S5RE19_9PROT|nr:hypothetical protein HCUR_00200 [Holospora curviuscula]